MNDEMKRAGFCVGWFVLMLAKITIKPALKQFTEAVSARMGRFRKSWISLKLGRIFFACF